MTYTVNLAENEIKKIIAEHIGNCDASNVFFHVSENDSFYGGTVVSASVTLKSVPTATKIPTAKEADAL